MRAEPFADMPIWPEGLEPFAEPAETRSLGRLVDPTDEIDRLTDVTVPSLTFCPASGKGPRPAVLVCPGGGYSILAWNHEGTAVAAWLNANGISAFLLKYRCPDRRSAAKADAVRAMRLIRARAAELNVMPDRIGILGFSAGAHLAARVCNLGAAPVYEPVDAVDAVSPRPDFSLLIYPAYLFRDGYALDPELAVSSSTPPVFMIQAEDDGDLVLSSLAYFIAMRQAKVPAELHLFSRGGHGYGMFRRGNPTDVWPRLAMRWFETDVMKTEVW